ncbi:HAD family hydrolase [Chitinophaga sp. Hz27]|uniref:HAD family hydrolase n=1 Tax=Chitinophaga sp. Hz27 TaxID=3347169 RepID=UPI0035E1BFD2
MRDKIKTIAFDADDTLWVNEPYFRESEEKFCELLSAYLPADQVTKILFETEIKNLKLYGYGIKGFMLSMIETLHQITKGNHAADLIPEIIRMGQEQLQKPVELLDGVPKVLEQLSGKYQLVVATKGDLLDQQRKIKTSGLEKYFQHVEIMSDKKTNDYSKLLKHLNCAPGNFLMLGNSVKSDVLPVLELEGYASHIPFHTTWMHEVHEEEPVHPNFLKLNTISDILGHLD